jgi:hypothetical protein
MADLTEVYAALQKADAAGDTEGAKKLADYIRSQSAAPEAVTAPSTKNSVPPVTTSEGMPAPRSAFEAILRHTSPAYMAVNNQFAPDYLSQAAAAAGRGLLKNWGTLGGLGDIVNKPSATPGAPPEGAGFPATSQEVEQAAGLQKTPEGYGQYEFLGGLLGPGLIAKGAGAVSSGVRGAFEAGRNFVNPTANALLAATGKQAPEIVNALRAGTPGLETAGAAAAPVGSVEFSKFAKSLEPYAAQANADITKAKDAVLGGNAASVETAANDAAKTVASDIAAPDVQKVGDNLINIAEKEKKLSQQTVIGPKFKAAEELGKGVDIEIPDVLKKANELVDTIDPDAAAVLSRKLSKFQGETTTPEFIGPGGATFKGKPVTAPPTATLKDIGDIRTAINDAAAKAKAAGSDGDYKRLMELHDEVTNAVKNSETLSPEAKNAYFDAVDTYKTEHAPRFKTGLQVNLFKISKGENGITPSNVINKFFNNADTTDNFVALFGKNPSAMSEAQKGMEGLYRDKVIKDGVIDQAAHDAFMKRYGAQIDKLDAAGLNIRDKLNNAVENTKTALSPINDVAEVRAAINQAPLPAGAKADEIASRAQALGSALPPDELEKALQIARRGQEYDRLAGSKTSAPSEVPISKPIGFTPLEWGKRVFVEAMKKVGSKLSDKLTTQLAAQFTDPHQAADVIEQALKYRAAQDARKAATASGAAANTNVINQLAPAGATINALAEQRR